MATENQSDIPSVPHSSVKAEGKLGETDLSFPTKIVMLGVMRTEPVRSLTTNAKSLISGLGRGASPILLLDDNKPAAYLVDVASYDALRRRMDILEGIARGENAIKEGRIMTHAQAKKKLTRWLK